MAGASGLEFAHLCQDHCNSCNLQRSDFVDLGRCRNIHPVIPSILPIDSSGVRTVQLMDDFTVTMPVHNADDRSFDVTCDLYRRLARLREALSVISGNPTPNSQFVVDATASLYSMDTMTAWPIWTAFCTLLSR